MITIYYDVKPSMVIRKMKIATKPDPIKEEVQLLHSNEHFSILYDPDNGMAFNINDLENLSRSINEIKHVLKEAKLPLINKNQPLLHIREWAFMSGKDREVLETQGFTKDTIMLERVEWSLGATSGTNMEF